VPTLKEVALLTLKEVVLPTLKEVVILLFIMAAPTSKVISSLYTRHILTLSRIL
jgi:hypothetical protein